MTTTWMRSGSELDSVLEGRRQHLLTEARFLGLATGGRAAARKGMLVLCERTLEYVSGLKSQRFTIRLGDVRAVSVVDSWRGKPVVSPVLALDFYTPRGHDAAAWTVRDPLAWRATIDVLRAGVY